MSCEDAIEGVKTTSDDKPIAPITIARCGAPSWLHDMVAHWSNIVSNAGRWPAGQVERRVIGVRPVKRKKARHEKTCRRFGGLLLTSEKSSGQRSELELRLIFK